MAGSYLISWATVRFSTTVLEALSDQRPAKRSVQLPASKRMFPLWKDFLNSSGVAQYYDPHVPRRPNMKLSFVRCPLRDMSSELCAYICETLSLRTLSKWLKIVAHFHPQGKEMSLKDYHARSQNLLGCTAGFLIECRPTFQRYVLPPSSERWVLKLGW
jgi:hypothetical protein